MANYREKNAPGTQWTRCSKVIIENPLNAAGFVRFSEDTVVSLADTVIVASSGEVASPIDLSIDIPIIDINTGQPTLSTFKPSDLYNMLYSCYIYYATKRDEDILNAIAAEEANKLRAAQLAQGIITIPTDSRIFVDNTLPLP